MTLEAKTMNSLILGLIVCKIGYQVHTCKQMRADEECCSSVIECSPLGRRVASLSLTGGTVLCLEPEDTLSSLCLVLVQPRQSGKSPSMTEKLLSGK